MKILLLSYNNLKKIEIIKRPSKVCKTPYVGDGIIHDDSQKNEFMIHTPSLGCCGLCEKESIVYGMPLNNEKIKCSYRSIISFDKKNNNSLVGIEPSHGEKIVELVFENNLLSNLINIKNYKKQVTFNKSRFDFAGELQDNRKFILEVKSVPLQENNIAYFPDGYRKKKTDLVSPRAFKHIEELSQICQNNNANNDSSKEITNCYMCYVIQRNDINKFMISNNDKIYKDAVQKAMENNVKIIVIVCDWDNDGNLYLIYDKCKLFSNFEEIFNLS